MMQHRLSSVSDRDSLFASHGDVVDFAFDAAVARVFPDMIRRSVPGYDAQVGLIGVLASRFAQPYSLIYDLGCSLGGAAFSIQQRVKTPGLEIVAVDCSADMLERAEKLKSLFPAPESAPTLQFVRADIVDLPLKPASVVVLNFVVQFMQPEKRKPFLRRVWESLLPGGVLLLAEKVHSEPLLSDLHLDFKRGNGYSELEISAKRAALENVMKLDSIPSHEERLKSVGFSRVLIWNQCLNFVSFLAFR